jgi:hypothetical protein
MRIWLDIRWRRRPFTGEKRPRPSPLPSLPPSCRHPLFPLDLSLAPSHLFSLHPHPPCPHGDRSFVRCESTLHSLKILIASRAHVLRCSMWCVFPDSISLRLHHPHLRPLHRHGVHTPFSQHVSRHLFPSADPDDFQCRVSVAHRRRQSRQSSSCVGE